VPYVIRSLIDTEADAATEAARLLPIYKRTRHQYTVDVWNKLYFYQLGDVVTLQIPRYDLTEGKNFIVAGYDEAPVFEPGNHQNAVRLVLWGRETGA
jgi:hypothetical protein